MKFPKTSCYDQTFVAKHLMGPNCLMLLEELTSSLPLKEDMRVLDLGCGRGLTSIFLAKEFGVHVFATDLWIPATVNYQTFQELGLEDQIIPIHANALDLPYADEYFDAVISVDSYHYFADNDTYMDEKLAPLLKKNGLFAIAVPGLKEEITGELPKEMSLSWSKDDIKEMHTCQWWRNTLEKSKFITIQSISELECFDEAWNDWIYSTGDFKEYSKSDKPAIEAGAGKYLNFVSMIGQKK